jgi:hypothetical protein
MWLVFMDSSPPPLSLFRELLNLELASSTTFEPQKTQMRTKILIIFQ